MQPRTSWKQSQLWPHPTVNSAACRRMRCAMLGFDMVCVVPGATALIVTPDGLPAPPPLPVSRSSKVILFPPFRFDNNHHHTPTTLSPFRFPSHRSSLIHMVWCATVVAHAMRFKWTYRRRRGAGLQLCSCIRSTGIPQKCPMAPRYLSVYARAAESLVLTSSLVVLGLDRLVHASSFLASNGREQATEKCW